MELEFQEPVDKKVFPYKLLRIDPWHKRKNNFKTTRDLVYNKKLCMRYLKCCLKKSLSDQIHYDILRHLPVETLHILLEIIDKVIGMVSINNKRIN